MDACAFMCAHVWMWVFVCACVLVCMCDCTAWSDAAAVWNACYSQVHTRVVRLGAHQHAGICDPIPPPHPPTHTHNLHPPTHTHTHTPLTQVHWAGRSARPAGLLHTLHRCADGGRAQSGWHPRRACGAAIHPAIAHHPPPHNNTCVCTCTVTCAHAHAHALSHSHKHTCTHTRTRTPPTTLPMTAPNSRLRPSPCSRPDPSLGVAAAPTASPPPWLPPCSDCSRCCSRASAALRATADGGWAPGLLLGLTPLNPAGAAWSRFKAVGERREEAEAAAPPLPPLPAAPAAAADRPCAPAPAAGPCAPLPSPFPGVRGMRLPPPVMVRIWATASGLFDTCRATAVGGAGAADLRTARVLSSSDAGRSLSDEMSASRVLYRHICREGRGRVVGPDES